MASKFGFAAKGAAWGGLKRLALTEIAKDAKRTFDNAFQREGLEGGKKWDEAQRRIPGTLAYRMAKGDERSAKKLTGQTKTLANSNVIKGVTEREAVIENATPYAQVQNEGGMVGGGITKIPHSIPERPFMTQTKKITADQLQILKAVTGRVWKIK